ncbi:hypothetical protein NKR23_g2007 [Pleurostoma richardsiae]|uniref:Peptidase A1 domain-containing protein n=1 Tax=Pleurostoma richardsiae TaxID=41990 RepID=A0AA38VJH2_9PEZI|nr:hypothetical protein NKR23_g2007 [Pleurostoma richardsiae]
MRQQRQLLLTAVALYGIAGGPASGAIADQGISFLHLPVRTGTRHIRAPGLSRRAFSPVNFTKSADYYTVLLSIGTPPQKISVELDTGSADIWVNPICANAGPLPGSTEECEAAGIYDPSAAVPVQSSSTVTGQSLVGFGPFAGDAVLNYYHDVVSLGDLTVASQLFGIASDSHNETYGRLGLGPHPVYGFNDSLFLSSVAKQGSISSRAFSLYFQPVDDATDGSLLLGGIDRGKFQGALQKLPIIPASEAPINNTWANWVRLDDLSVYLPPLPTATSYKLPQNLPSGGGTGAIIDSGSPAIGLPSNVTAAIYEQLGVQSTTSSDGFPLNKVDCGMRGADGFFNFGFGGTEIGVPVREVVLDGAALGFASGECYLTVYANDVPVLGSPFLRAAYAVFDWDNQNIHLARSANCGTDIVAIGSGPDAVGSPSGNCTPSPKRKIQAERRYGF